MQLYAAELGEMSAKGQSLRGFGSGVMEIRPMMRAETYRGVYTVFIGGRENGPNR